MFLLHYLTSLGIQLTGNPVRAHVRRPAAPTAALIEAISAALGLDDPCLDQAGNPCLAALR